MPMQIGLPHLFAGLGALVILLQGRRGDEGSRVRIRWALVGLLILLGAMLLCSQISQHLLGSAAAREIRAISLAFPRSRRLRRRALRHGRRGSSEHCRPAREADRFPDGAGRRARRLLPLLFASPLPGGRRAHGFRDAYDLGEGRCPRRGRVSHPLGIRDQTSGHPHRRGTRHEQRRLPAARRPAKAHATVCRTGDRRRPANRFTDTTGFNDSPLQCANGRPRRRPVAAVLVPRLAGHQSTVFRPRPLLPGCPPSSRARCPRAITSSSSAVTRCPSAAPVSSSLWWRSPHWRHDDRRTHRQHATGRTET